VENKKICKIGHALLASSLCLVAEAAAPVGNQIRTWNIPSEDAITALRDFGQQSGVGIAGEPGDLQGKRVNAVAGTWSIDDALKQLFAGVGLQYRYIGNGGGIVVTRASISPAGKDRPMVPKQHSDPVLPEPETPVLLEEIVVTVRKTSENLQMVPVSATIYSAADIAARSATSLADLAQATPNVSFQSAASNDGGAASSTIYIRGVGTNLVGIGSEGGVSTYLNGVYLARAQGLNMDLGDVERVELALGPQGDLYGKNTPGGAINVITELPSTDKLSGQVRAITGSFDRADGLLSVNVPVSKEFAIRFAGASRHEDGYGHRLLDGEATGDTHENVARLSAIWKPNDAWDLVATVDATRDDEHDTDFRVAAVTTPALIGLYNKLFTPRYGTQFIPANVYDSYGTGPNTNAQLFWGAAITTTWHEGSFDVKSISGFRHNVTT